MNVTKPPAKTSSLLAMDKGQDSRPLSSREKVSDWEHRDHADAAARATPNVPIDLSQEGENVKPQSQRLQPHQDQDTKPPRGGPPKRRKVKGDHGSPSADEISSSEHETGHQELGQAQPRHIPRKMSSPSPSEAFSSRPNFGSRLPSPTDSTGSASHSPTLSKLSHEPQSQQNDASADLAGISEARPGDLDETFLHKSHSSSLELED